MRAHRLLLMAARGLWLHRLRSVLTVLGIILGVGAVVAMLAVGEGASEEAQQQIRRMGSRNLLLASVAPPQGESVGQGSARVLSYGIEHEDVERIRDTLPGIGRIVARKDVAAEVRFGPRKYTASLVGIDPAYREVAGLRLRSGRFLTADDGRKRRAVCVIGDEVAARLFFSADPIGQTVRARSEYYLVVGVLERRGEGTGGTAGVGGESDSLVLIPLDVMRERLGDTITTRSSGSFTREKIELTRVTIEAARVEDVPVVAEGLRSLLVRWHPRDDVRLTVPLELLRQAEETKRMWNIVLGTIAGISLLVGGIGIMNIMLASVVERTREVGIRRALGARKRHIVAQFLSESVLLALAGGPFGAVLGGVLFPLLATALFGVPTIVKPESVILALSISASVGILSGIYPASRAANLHPVQALRHD
jgi:putative ABC transport system permease protein